MIDPVTFPFQTGPNVLSATVDTMTVSFSDILPTSVQQSQVNVPVARMNVQASGNYYIKVAALNPFGTHNTGNYCLTADFNAAAPIQFTSVLNSRCKSR